MPRAVTVVGLTQAKARVASLGVRAARPQPAFKEIAHIVREGLKQNWEDQGASFGARWAARAREDAPGQLMDVTGTLHGQLGSKAIMTPRQVKIRTKDFIARFKQFGTVHEPRRVIVGVTEPDEVRLAAVVHRYLMSHE